MKSNKRRENWGRGSHVCGRHEGVTLGDLGGLAHFNLVRRPADILVLQGRAFEDLFLFFEVLLQLLHDLINNFVHGVKAGVGPVVGNNLPGGLCKVVVKGLIKVVELQGEIRKSRDQVVKPD